MGNLAIGENLLTIGSDFLVIGEGTEPETKSMQLTLTLKWTDGSLQIDGVGDWID